VFNNYYPPPSQFMKIGNIPEHIKVTFMISVTACRCAGF
jgi:hypothetical protein